MCFFITGRTSLIVISLPSSALSEVTFAPEIPHGIIFSYADKSGFTFKAKPCMVTPFATRSPIAAIFRSLLSSLTQTPLRSQYRSKWAQAT